VQSIGCLSTYCRADGYNCNSLPDVSYLHEILFVLQMNFMKELMQLCYTFFSMLQISEEPIINNSLFKLESYGMELFTNLKEWFVSIHIQEQIRDVDFTGLFTNPWFIIPFALMVCYLLYKQSWRDLIIITIFIAVWWVSGTDYMNSLLVDGEIQIGKILPVIFGGAAVLGFVIYLFFGRSD